MVESMGPSRKDNLYRRRRAFTLVELVVSFSVFLIVMIPVFKTFSEISHAEYRLKHGKIDSAELVSIFKTIEKMEESQLSIELASSLLNTLYKDIAFSVNENKIKITEKARKNSIAISYLVFSEDLP